MQKLIRLLLSIILCLYTGIVGSVFTAEAIPGWYTTLQKPFFTPPGWLFAPVWTVLYILMGISFYLVWTHRANRNEKKYAISLFLLQLGYNALWSMIFFGMRNILFGFVTILYLWFFIVLTVIEFKKISRPAAWLLAPYLVWVTYAAMLNASILLLNR